VEGGGGNFQTRRRRRRARPGRGDSLHTDIQTKEKELNGPIDWGREGARPGWHLNPLHVVDLMEGSPLPDLGAPAMNLDESPGPP
jgi:hypothetical protein